MEIHHVRKKDYMRHSLNSLNEPYNETQYNPVYSPPLWSLDYEAHMHEACENAEEELWASDTPLY